MANFTVRALLYLSLLFFVGILPTGYVVAADGDQLNAFVEAGDNGQLPEYEEPDDLLDWRFVAQTHDPHTTPGEIGPTVSAFCYTSLKTPHAIRAPPVDFSLISR